MASKTTRTWKFFRSGGSDQLLLRSGEEILDLKNLDPKLWVALGCPVQGLQMDARTLATLDEDNDGTIRVQEVLAACAWISEVFDEPDRLIEGTQALPFSAFSETEEGKAIHEAARTLAEILGHPEATSLTVEEATKGVETFRKSAFNGDGILPPGSGRSEAEKALLKAILETREGLLDASGAMGVNRVGAGEFYAQSEDRIRWIEEGEALVEADPLKEKLPPAYQAFAKVEAAVEDFFARVAVAAFDPASEKVLNPSPEAFAELATRRLTRRDEALRSMPLAAVSPEADLPLSSGLNPAWVQDLEAFRDQCVEPILGKRSKLSRKDFLAIRKHLGTYQAWAKAPRGKAVEKFDKATLQGFLDETLRESLNEAFSEDERLHEISERFDEVEKAVRLNRDFYTLLRNFVSFEDFYSPVTKAIFQAGRLYLDERSSDMVLEIQDIGKHASMAGLAGIYLVYCECTRGGAQAKKNIVAAITAGDSENLMVGRNGVFYDRDGKDWNAKVVRIVDHPISLGQAFWSPYKKAVRWIEAQVLARAEAAEGAGAKKLEAEASSLVELKTEPKEKDKKSFDVGVIAALGVAVSGLTAALGAILEAFFGLGIWMPLGFLGLIAMISGPSMLIAWLKLRRRSIGPLLDASGWAVNSRARLTVPFGRSLTRVALLPEGADASAEDPFEEKRFPWKRLGLVCLVVFAGWSWYTARLDAYLPPKYRRIQEAAKAPGTSPEVQAEAVAPGATPPGEK